MRHLTVLISVCCIDLCVYTCWVHQFANFWVFYFDLSPVELTTCSSVIAKVSVPYRHAGVTQVLMTLPS